MNTKIRDMRQEDAECVISMMRGFYASPAVHTNGSEEIFKSDVENCLSDNPYLEGYIIEEAEEVIGYAMVAKSFSTEFGKRCIWIEDLFLKERWRGAGIGKTFFDFITEKYEDSIFRLEVEAENECAVKLYTKCGFSPLPYVEMKK